MADTVPGRLVPAHARCTTPMPAQRPPAGAATVWGPVGDCSCEAHPTPRDDGAVLWWLVDDTDHRLAREALRTERERTEFLVHSWTSPRGWPPITSPTRPC
ncbi:hypothetical protein [Streptomyces lavendulae]|uniref:hypothetical protein n=1 Tax=Streptomyces lavendulae TaxID=1914 RepID=UPI0036E105F7